MRTMVVMASTLEKGWSMPPRPKSKYRVYFDQINAQFVEVEAVDGGDAVEKAKRKWRREVAHPSGAYVEVHGKNGYQED